MDSFLKIFSSVGVIKAISAFFQILLVYVVNEVVNVDQASDFFWSLSVMMIMSTVCKAGQESLLLKKVSAINSHYEKNKIKAASVLIVFKMWLLMSGISFFVLSIKLEYMPSLFMTLSILFVSMINLASFSLQAEKFFKKAAFLLNGYFNLTLIVIVVLSSTLFCYSENDIFFFSLLSSLFVFIFFVPKKLKFDEANLEYQKKLLIEGKYFYFTTLISILMNWSPAFITGLIVDDVNAVSDLITSQRVSIIISFFLTIVNSFLGPVISQSIFQGESAKAYYVYLKATKYIAIFAIPAFIFIYLNILIFSDIFQINNVLVLKLTLLAQLVNALTGPVGLYLNMSGHSRAITNISFFSLMLGIILLIILGILYGVVGVAFSVLVMVLTSNVSSLFYFRNKVVK